MSFTRDDVRRKMGYCEGDQYRNICEKNFHSMHERVDRFNVRDGAEHTRTGDEAVKALEQLEKERSRERQEENYSEY